MEYKENGITTLLNLYFYSPSLPHVNERKTSDLSGELAYITEMGSIFTIADCMCVSVFVLLVCICGHES